MWRISLVLLICLVAGRAYSNPPSPAPPKAEQKNQEHTQDNQKPTSTDQRGTESSPLFIKVIPPLTVEPSPTEHAQQSNGYTSPEWWLVWVTLILAAITAILAGYTAKLWGATKSLAEDAKRTADRQASEMQASLRIAQETAGAATRSADIAEKSLVAAQRAFLFIDTIQTGANIPPTDQPPRHISGYFFWTECINSGPTPARNVGCWASHQVRPANSHQEILFVKPGDSPLTPVGPKQLIRSQQIFIPIEILMRAFRNEIEIFFWVRLEYTDIFNSQNHHTEICTMIFPLRDPSIINHPGEGAGREIFHYPHYGNQNGSS